MYSPSASFRIRLAGIFGAWAKSNSRLVQKHKNKSVDTFSLRVFGEVTASLEVAFQSRSQHWQWFAARLGGFKSAGFNGCRERPHSPTTSDRDSTASILNHAASR